MINSGFKMTRLHAQGAKLGESPMWHPEEKKFYWTDMLSKRIFSLTLPEDGSAPTEKDVKMHALDN